MTVIAFLTLCMFAGGASRIDVAGLMLLHPAAIIAITTVLLIPGPVRWRAVGVPLILLAGLGMIMVIQLLPLPPAIWTSLGGRQAFAEGAALAGLTELPWRPISVTPDLTLASLVGLSVPLAVLVGFAALEREQTYRLALFLLAAIAVSAIFALGQLAGGTNSSFYLYAVTNNMSPVGLFANRNHQALLLAMAFPLLALWLVTSDKQPGNGTRFWVAAASAFAIVALVMVTGSRAGLLFGMFSLACGAYLLRRLWPPQMAMSVELRKAALIGASVVAVGLAVAIWLYARDETAQRLIATSFTDESRLRFLPVLWTIAVDFFPLGSGFGSFDPVFRFYEPFELLKPTYFNHAHNDLIELAITGGLPALVLLALFLCWFVVQSMAALSKRGERRASALAIASSVIVLLILLSSVVDYPLRTPFIAAVFAIACGFLQQFRARDTEA